MSILSGPQKKLSELANLISLKLILRYWQTTACTDLSKLTLLGSRMYFTRYAGDQGFLRLFSPRRTKSRGSHLSPLLECESETYDEPWPSHNGRDGHWSGNHDPPLNFGNSFDPSAFQSVIGFLSPWLYESLTRISRFFEMESGVGMLSLWECRGILK